jgi:hypothetical protein
MRYLNLGCICLAWSAMSIAVLCAAPGDCYTIPGNFCQVAANGNCTSPQRCLNNSGTCTYMGVTSNFSSQSWDAIAHAQCVTAAGFTCYNTPSNPVDCYNMIQWTGNACNGAAVCTYNGNVAGCVGNQNVCTRVDPE